MALLKHMEYKTPKAPRRHKPNYFYSIIGVALVLFLIGFFGLIILQGQKLVTLYKEKVNLMVEFKPKAVETEKEAVISHLERSKYAKPGSVVYTSKEEAAELLREDFGEDFIKLGFSNPLFDVVNFNTKSEYMHVDSLSKIKAQLLNIPGVSDVFYQEGLVDNIARNLEKIGLFSLIIGILFIFVAIMLIHNTIKLALYSNRFLIKNMELIGASWGFISKPYLSKSLKNGFWSALIAIALLVGLIFLVQMDLSEFRTMIDPLMLGILFGGLIILGVLITGLSTYYVVNKYLRMRIDDLY